ncbi:MAG: integrase core domain-containing protein [Gaiellaceae bacterium MAG52_C11]|nr:integrase core domain-containing protein [Candidatus Gaiellasilicea maunaloa]
MIRLEADISTARFVRLLGVPERSYRRWQQRQRQGRPVKGPWPAPAQDRVEPVAIEYADRFPAWGHRKVAELMRIDGHRGPDSTVLRALRRTGRVQPVDYQAERRQHAQARRAAFVVPPSGPNQVWQLDFSEFETSCGGTWRIGGTADYWSKLELGWHVSTTQNHRDAIETLEQAIRESDALTGRPLRELLADPVSGEIRPIAVVTDNGPCFKSVRFAAYIDRRPELIHIRTRRKSPGQNGVRERAFGSLKYEHLYRQEIDDGHQLGLEVEAYRQLFNRTRPHQAIGMRRPLDVHLEACNDPQTTNSTEPETLPLS